MAWERVLTVSDGKVVAPAAEVGLAELGYKERQHLQQWIIDDPSLIEEGLLILTEEYDRWSAGDSTTVKDRLDLLALDRSGRLVVIELKRDDAPSNVHLQAITYAAMISRCTESDLATIHAEFLNRGVEGSQSPLSAAEALERIREQCDGDIDPDLLASPRIILVARNFPRQVTSSAVWLSQMGLDITLVQVGAWKTADLGPEVITTSVLYPVPGVEEFTVEVGRAEKVRAKQKASDNARNAKTVTRLIEASVLIEGAQLTFNPQVWGNPETALEVADWVSDNPDRGVATWTEHIQQPLIWKIDGKTYSPTGLTKQIFERATGDRPSNMHGPRFWLDDQGRDLVTLAERI